MSEHDSNNGLNIPKHIAIIMDGNRRWAKKRKMPAIYGHNAGMKTVRKIVEHCKNLNVEYLSLFAFSTENWNRSNEEVGGLMTLFKTFCQKERKNLYNNNVRLKFIGDIDALSSELRDIAHETEDFLADCNGLHLNICINYSGKSEILHAIKKIGADLLAHEMSAEKMMEFEEEDFCNYLYTRSIPDVDLLIRTSGECRISNYYLWQIAYSEMIFIDDLWPDFDEKKLDFCMEEYNKRSRRFGVG